MDSALHNLFALAEGFYRIEAGPEKPMELVLMLRVRGKDGRTVEEIEISPNKIDLPIGYWKWVDHEFQ